MDIEDKIKNLEEKTLSEKATIAVLVATATLGAIYLAKTCLPLLYKEIQVFCESLSYIR